MFEGVVATLLNRYLGKYIQDLDTENLNVGIFSGDVQLTELKLKPEALVSFLSQANNFHNNVEVLHLDYILYSLFNITYLREL